MLNFHLVCDLGGLGASEATQDPSSFVVQIRGSEKSRMDCISRWGLKLKKKNQEAMSSVSLEYIHSFMISWVPTLC